MPARKKRAPATNNKCDKKQAPDSNTNGNSSDKTKPNEFIPSYEERYKSMKIRLKEILYENELIRDEVRNLQRTLLDIYSDKDALLERLFQIEQQHQQQQQQQHLPQQSIQQIQSQQLIQQQPHRQIVVLPPQNNLVQQQQQLHQQQEHQQQQLHQQQEAHQQQQQQLQLQYPSPTLDPSPNQPQLQELSQPQQQIQQQQQQQQQQQLSQPPQLQPQQSTFRVTYHEMDQPSLPVWESNVPNELVSNNFTIKFMAED